MSDTPRTDKLYEEVWRFTNETDAVDALISMRDLCRELEREKAALRSDLSKCNNLSEIRRDAFYDEKSARWAMVDRVRELERENAKLNHALNIAQTELRLNGCAKAADEVAKLHDAARKEAQP